MAVSKYDKDEMGSFIAYLNSNESENAKRHLLFPIFKKLFADKLKSESAAAGADVYIDGQLLVECKSDASQWLDGFYQALHYQRRFGLGYDTIIVLAYKFVGIWKLSKLPEAVTELSKTANAHKAPNEIGKENAKKTGVVLKREIQNAAQYWLTPKDLDGDIFAKNITVESYEILKILKNLKSDRQQIGTHNFIVAIERMKAYFETPIEAVHAFYTIIYFWDISSKVIEVGTDGDRVQVLGYHGNKTSEAISIRPRDLDDFKRFINSQYIFTNEGSGLTVDYYFSRFDEVLAVIDPEYVIQHGIFFTYANLSKFALWFAQQHFPGNINDDFIMFDPAGGSGNLVSSWRGKLKHKIVSELQPDLLKTIERRMQADPYHIETGFTIIPKTSDGIGLNFLDKSGADYLQILMNELNRKNVKLDKSLCFLLNPPYKNTDENVKEREQTASEYTLHPSITALTGEDAGKERYLAFLAQILNIAKEYQTIVPNNGKRNGDIVMIFTPTSWLIPRTTYRPFREEWDKYFRFHSGFIITSNEFFKLKGKWPLAFTIWVYDESPKTNTVKLYDCTGWNKQTLKLPFDNLEQNDFLEQQLNSLLSKVEIVKMDNSRGDIRETLPLIDKNGKLIQQPRYDYSHAKRTEDEGKLVSGFPLKDKERHFGLKRKCGSINGTFIGMMDDNSLVRIEQDSCKRMSLKPDRIWFRLDSVFININQTKVFNCASDNRSYCAYDLESAKATCMWFAITKALNGVYPVWANQYDIWAINPNLMQGEKEALFYSLCFAFVLGENRCVVTKFEENNPVQGAPEVFVDNPLCPTNKESFWATTLQPFINETKAKYGNNKENATLEGATSLIDSITDLYRYWNKEYCKGDWLRNIGLQNEPYFKYFDYADFLTPYSGLIQLEKYAKINQEYELLAKLEAVSQQTKGVKQTIYKMLVEDFEYFK